MASITVVAVAAVDIVGVAAVGGGVAVLAIVADVQSTAQN